MEKYTGPIYGNEMRPRKKHHVMGIISFICSLIIPISYFGLALGILDVVTDKKKEHKHTLSIWAIVIGSIFSLFLFLLFFVSSEPTESDTATVEEKIVDTTEETADDSEDVVPEITKDDFIASCDDLKENYKSILRNPEQYEGKNYSLTCYVSNVSESWGTKYYTVYYVDVNKAQKRVIDGWDDDLEEAYENVYDYDYSVWLFDDRDTDSDDYFKILEGDVITVYGTFESTSESKNSLTRETGEQMSLNIKYADLIAE